MMWKKTNINMKIETNITKRIIGTKFCTLNWKQLGQQFKREIFHQSHKIWIRDFEIEFIPTLFFILSELKQTLKTFPSCNLLLLLNMDVYATVNLVHWTLSINQDEDVMFYRLRINQSDVHSFIITKRLYKRHPIYIWALLT